MACQLCNMIFCRANKAFSLSIWLLLLAYLIMKALALSFSITCFPYGWKRQNSPRSWQAIATFLRYYSSCPYGFSISVILLKSSSKFATSYIYLKLFFSNSLTCSLQNFSLCTGPSWKFLFTSSFSYFSNEDNILKFLSRISPTYSISARHSLSLIVPFNKVSTDFYNLASIINSIVSGQLSHKFLKQANATLASFSLEILWITSDIYPKIYLLLKWV